MNNSTKYCIIYAVLCMQTDEKLSVGLISFGEGGKEYRYSQRKLDALEILLPKKVHQFFSNLIKTLDVEQFCTPSNIDYMNRYSNNLLAISKINTIDVPFSKESTDWLFLNFIETT